MSTTSAIPNMNMSIRVISLFASVAVHAAVLMGIPSFIGETGSGPAESSSTLYVSVHRSEPADDMPRDNPDMNSQKQPHVQQTGVPASQNSVQQPEPDASPEVLKVHAAATKYQSKRKQKSAPMARLAATSQPASNKSGANVEQKQPMQVATSGQSARLSRDYRSALLRLIERYKYYPLRARRNGQEGTSTVSFTVNSNGNILGITLARSSGTKLLDLAAIQTIKRIGQAPPLPDGRNRWKFTIPMTYDLK
jgi:periplasmic protein TonB